MRELVDILYEDESVLVLNKPNGLLTTAPAGIDNLKIRIQEYQCWKHHQRDVYIGIVHRLDRPVSGAIVFGLSRPVTRKLCDQFQNRTVKKQYWVFVEGDLVCESGRWKDTMRKLPNQAQSEIASPDHPDAKEAIADVQVLHKSNRGTLLQVELQTGRTHQIRLQAASRGHPVIGDLQYHADSYLGPKRDDVRQQPIALHARSLFFNHPVTAQEIQVVAPLPDVWNTLDMDPAKH